MNEYFYLDMIYFKKGVENSVDPNDDLQLRLIGDLVPISSKNNNYGPYPAILGQITLVMLFDGAIS